MSLKFTVQNRTNTNKTNYLYYKFDKMDIKKFYLFKIKSTKYLFYWTTFIGDIKIKIK